MAGKKIDFSSSLSQLEDTLELYLVKKAPELPNTIKDLIVVLLPWLISFTALTKFIRIFTILGLGSFFSSISFLTAPISPMSFNFFYSFSTIILAVALVFNIIALPGLFGRKAKGWKYLYWASLIIFLSNAFISIFPAILWSLIILYFIFQIKTYYK